MAIADIMATIRNAIPAYRKLPEKYHTTIATMIAGNRTMAAATINMMISAPMMRRISPPKRSGTPVSIGGIMLSRKASKIIIETELYS